MKPRSALLLIPLHMCVAASAGESNSAAAITRDTSEGSFALSSSVITIGRNVLVSTHSSREHAEVTATADLRDPNRLAACAIIERLAGEGILGQRTNTVLYVSHDGGRTWRSAVEDSPDVAERDDVAPAAMKSWDPTCTYGSNGALFFGTGTHIDETGARIRIHRSPDGGRTWLEPTIVDGFFDKPWLVADTRLVNSAEGRLYLAYVGGPRTVDIRTSVDGAETFNLPVRTEKMSRSTTPHGGAVLSDGTAVLGTRGPGVVVTVDGGAHVEHRSIIASSSGYAAGDMPSLAADVSGGTFRDRLYAAWRAKSEGRSQIFFAYSTDGGHTWSQPRVVNDDAARRVENTGPDNILPAIAVNKDGVVGVSWYDRRNHPDNASYDVRFSASFDGGESWLPSVLVSERPNIARRPLEARQAIGLNASTGGPDPASSSGATIALSMYRWEWLESGHYAGLTVTADGAFHPVWIDSRTGVKQVWTAPVRVAGRASRFGIETLDGLKDVTGAVRLTLRDWTYERTGSDSGFITGTVYVTNASADTVYGPLIMRLIEGKMTTARIEFDVSSDGRMKGSAWDLSGGLQRGALPAGATTAPVQVRFRLWDIAPDPTPNYSSLEQQEIFLNAFVRVLGGGTRGKK